MKRISDLMGGTKALAKIKPPNRSYEDWRRFINDCIEAGVIVVEADEKGLPVRYSGVMANAIARRIGWLCDSQGRIPYREAEEQFNAAIERSRAAERQSSRHVEEKRAKAISETAEQRKRRTRRPQDGYAPTDEADLLMDYANEQIPPP